MRYKPKVGKELALSVALVVAKTRLVTEVTRSTIALAVVIVVLATLASTAVLCVFRGDFQLLQVLWAVVAAPLGYVIGYYFRGNGWNGEEDNARPT